MAKTPHRGGIDRRPNPWLVSLGALAIVAFFGVPYALMFVTSLKTRLEVTDIPPVYFPAQPQFSNYITVWASSVNPASALVSTTVIAVGATLLVLLIVRQWRAAAAGWLPAVQSAFGLGALLYAAWSLFVIFALPLLF